MSRDAAISIISCLESLQFYHYSANSKQQSSESSLHHKVVTLLCWENTGLFDVPQSKQRCVREGHSHQT